MVGLGVVYPSNRGVLGASPNTCFEMNPKNGAVEEDSVEDSVHQKYDLNVCTKWEKYMYVFSSSV